MSTFKPSILLHDHLGVVVGMAEGHTDVVIKGHDAQGTTGPQPRPAQWLCRAMAPVSRAARRPSPGSAAGSARASGRHGAHSGSQSRSRGPSQHGGTAWPRAAAGPGCPGGRLAIRQADRALRAWRRRPWSPAMPTSRPPEDGVGPLLSGQKVAGLLLLALLAKAGQGVRTPPGVRKGPDSCRSSRA